MVKEKKELFARIVLILFCLTIFSACFWAMNQTYDPLARYPYANDQNREKILTYLDSDDIDYIISNQIHPDEFMDFIDVPGFDIRYCRLYTLCKETQNQENDYIVNFVNRYHTHFTAGSLETLLKHYSYLDLTTFYENEMTNNPTLKLVEDPIWPLLVLNNRTSVYKYAPQDLVSGHGIFLKQEAMDAYEDMNNAYKSMLESSDSLVLEKGYTAYENIFTEYTSLSTVSPEYVDTVFLPAGENEFQLGYTVALEGYNQWRTQVLSQEEVYKDHQYDLILDALDQTIRSKISWLEENAYRFGFVVRYPRGKESQTGHAYDPFVLRYVGKENAKAMKEKDNVMEQMNFSEELE